MKIGISCITYNRPLHLQHWIKQVAENSPEDAVIHIAEDTDKDRRGVAYRSNECLRKLRDCDFIFILNDDCFPVKKNWTDLFIRSSIETGHQHYQLQKESNETKIIAVARDTENPDTIPVGIFDNSNGCFLFFTKHCIETVGGFNEDFGIYGYEHSDLSRRIHQAGLTRFGQNCTPKGAEKFIYSLDLEPESELHRKLKHKGSMPSKEALMHIQKSAKVFQQPSEIYVPI